MRFRAETRGFREIAGLACVTGLCQQSGMGVYDFKAKTIDGEERSLADYKGKVLLVVNVASQCGLTPHYAGLQELYESFRDKGLVVLGFPCNQFGSQEPGPSPRSRPSARLATASRFRCSRRSTSTAPRGIRCTTT
jgi:glutathione peroxidase-family protein